MFKLTVDNLCYYTNTLNLSVLEFCKFAGINIPRFCYHELLSVAGNCRICLVEIKKVIKPMASCILPISNGMEIFTNSPLVKKARENTLESILLSHPLDCPICDQGGECDLQDQIKHYGRNFSKNFFNKIQVEDENWSGTSVKLRMSRCILCTRCVRFNEEIVGNEFKSINTFGRGSKTQISNYNSTPLVENQLEVFGNVIDLCPVGALTTKTFDFEDRSWKKKGDTFESIDLFDSTGSHVYIEFDANELSYKKNFIRISALKNSEINSSLISDKIRDSIDSITNNLLLPSNINKKNQDTKNVEVTTIETLETTFEANYFFNQSNIIFLIDDTLDLKKLNFLNKLIELYTGAFIDFCNDKEIKIKFRKSSYSNENSNFFFNSNNNLIKDLENNTNFFFLISSNIKLESVIINTKLRMKLLNNKEDITVFNLNFTNNYNLINNYEKDFIAINPLTFVKFLEGKIYILSKFFLKFKNPFLILGNSILQIFDFNYINSLIKKLIFSAIVIQIKESCNSAGIEHFPIVSFNYRDIKSTCGIFSINLNNDLMLFRDIFGNNIENDSWLNYDNFLKVKFFDLKEMFDINSKYKLYGKNSKFPSDVLSLSCYKENYWANVYNSTFAELHAPLTFSLLPFYKQESIYLNLEYRSQKTKTLFDLGLNRNITDILCFFIHCFFNSIFNKKSSFLKKSGIINKQFFKEKKNVYLILEMINVSLYDYQTKYICLEYLSDNTKNFSNFKDIYFNVESFFFNKKFNFFFKSLEPSLKKNWSDDQKYVNDTTLNSTNFKLFLKNKLK